MMVFTEVPEHTGKRTMGISLLSGLCEPAGEPVGT